MNPHSFPRSYAHDGNYDRSLMNGTSMDTYDYRSGFDGKSEDRSRDSRYVKEHSKSTSGQVFPTTGPTGKRGSRACVSCR